MVIKRCLQSAAGAVLLGLAGLGPAHAQGATPMNAPGMQMSAGAAAQNFPSAQAAVSAFVAATQANDRARLVAILGPGGAPLISSGDPVADAAARKKFLADYAAGHMLVTQPDGLVHLVVGADGWPLPIPLVEAKGDWHFDAAAGTQRVLDRRIGRDELRTIQTLFAVIEAERDYFDRMQRGSGAGAYTARLFSTPGTEDGLYWEAEGGPPSPAAPLIEQARAEGYTGDSDTAQVLYHGYDFRILMAQGPNAAGGARHYLQDGRMTGGFALIAWPAAYGNSGIMTFVTNQDGVIYQKDLGPDTAKAAAAVQKFDPDAGWARITVSN